MERYQTAVRPMAVPAQSANDILWITYRWMSVGLAITAVVAWLVAASPGATALFVQNPIMFYGLMFAQLGLVLAFNPVALRASAPVAATMFCVSSALIGLTFCTTLRLETR